MISKIKNIEINNFSNGPICKRSTNNIIADKLRRGVGKVIFCSNCSHGFLDSQNNSNLEKFYETEYRKEYSHKSEKESTNAKEIFEVYKEYQKERLDWIRPFLKKDYAFLEVGASSGQFLVHIKELISNINAIELDKDCCLFLSKIIGVNVENKILSKSKFRSRKFDIVCSFQVLEHVEDPIEFLMELKSVTNKGGKIFIEVPNLNDPLLEVWDVEKYKTFFYHSAHLHYFTGTSLEKVAIKAGFDKNAININYSQDYNLLNHIHWVINNMPQVDCHTGLSEINLYGKDKNISDWLSQELKILNDKYIRKLVDAKLTSNIIMRLDCNE